MSDHNFLQTAAGRRLERDLAKFREIIARKTTAFPNDSETDIRNRFKATEGSLEGFGKLYTPHYFTLPPCRMHNELDVMMDWPERHLFVISGPRERGKTARLRVGKLRMILTGSRKFMVKVTETSTRAIKDIQFVVLELEQNSRIRQDYIIEVLSNTGDDVQLKITPKATNQSHYVSLMARSYGQSLRGELANEDRIDYLEIDDFDSLKHGRNPKMGREKVDWVISEGYLAVSKKGVAIWVGNNFNKATALNIAQTTICQNRGDFAEKVTPIGDLLQRPVMSDLDSKNGLAPLGIDVLRGTDGGKRRSPAARKSGKSAELREQIRNWKQFDITAHVYQEIFVNEAGELVTLWPEKSDLEESIRLMNTIGTHRFEGEMQQNPVEEGLFFKAEWFKRFDPNNPPPFKFLVAACDQALGANATSCYKGFFILGCDGERYYVLDGWLRQDTTIAMIEAMYLYWNIYHKHGLRYFRIDDSFQQYTLVSSKDFDMVAKRIGIPLPIRPVSETIKKEIRIESLQPYIQTGKLVFPEKPNDDVARLEEQLLGYPDSAFRDGPDILYASVEEAVKTGFQSLSTFKPLGTRRMSKNRSSRQ